MPRDDRRDRNSTGRRDRTRRPSRSRSRSSSRRSSYSKRSDRSRRSSRRRSRSRSYSSSSRSRSYSRSRSASYSYSYSSSYSSRSPSPNRDKKSSESKPRTKESNGEISMSIEETNKLRASLNLPPLEVDDNEEKPSQSGEEISLSVEETNKLRAKLGLPPLEIDDESAPQTDSKGTVLIDMEKQRREAEIRAKLEKSRQERERRELHNLKGKGLGALLEEEYHDMDVKQWLSQSAEKQSKALEEMEEEEEAKEESRLKASKEVSQSLEGMKVGHAASDIQEGDTILTLRDAPLFDEQGNPVETEDVLENVEIADAEKQREINRLREKAKMPIYSGYDDDEFDPNYDANDRLLPQYSEKKRPDVFFRITKNGESKPIEQQTEAKPTSQTQSTTPTNIDNSRGENTLRQVLQNMDSKRVAEEYYSREEMAKFKPKRKRVRRIRESEDSRGTDKPSALKDLKEIEEEEGVGESHRRREENSEKEADLLREKRAAFEKARAKEELKNLPLQSAKASASTTAANTSSSVVSKEKTGLEGGVEGLSGLPEDVSLFESLTRARRVVLGKRRNRTEELAERLAKEREEEKKEGDDLGEVNEFVMRFKRIMTEREQEAKQNEEMGQSGLAKPMIIRKEEEEEKEEEKEEGNKEEEEKEEKKEEEEEEDLFEQPVLGKGLGDALRYLRSQKIDDVEEEAYGRRTDEVIRTNDANDGFSLENRDSSGRLLTTKEAFRQFSYQFHGKMPGRKNRDRKNRNYVTGMANKGIHSNVC